ncbi:long-chain fatty acid--CoA ligase [Rhodococcus sp. D-46]|uniref:long-chain-fatty-acid--CoA ligase n=1 Tax=unclassified Rhodococcus (in: high G+C Gram-positive bacteria) TaxID=192944 RepID=UPI000717F24C|nr:MULTISPECIES: long-chain-fatty-acid--CoA ligase [unclassified Rhodococcus (in: high G+C Gram-positive bacteria)]NHE64821.1 long-chain fatty acid--CoA ligase [Rhodococcus sp. D-46]
MHITQSLINTAQANPDHVVTIYRDRARTAAETIDRVARFAGALRALGAALGDRVGILALNSDRYHEFLHAVPWAGCVVTPVNVRWSAAEIAYSLVDSQTDILLVDDNFAPLIPDLRELAPNLSSVIFIGETQAPDGMLDYEQLVAGAGAVEDARRGGDDLYGIFYTGGTTGKPKGVMLSHRACLTSAMGSIVTADILNRGGVLLHAAPMFHLADLAAWLIACLTRATHVMVPSFTPAGVVEAITRHGVTDTLLVPTMIQLFVDSPEAKNSDLSSLTRIVYGASPISEALLQRTLELFPKVRLSQGYGMTEIAAIATILTADDHDDPTLRRSCGRPTAHSEVRIIGTGDVELPRGDIGEIVVRGDHLMSGYWNKPAETSAVIRDGWMHTGDAGYMNEDGYVFVVDRLKDMVITGGENVYTIEVENALAKHPAVAQVAVIGLPDENWGERVHAVVVLTPGTSVSEAELRDFCRMHIANYKLPRSTSFVDALPTSGAGKILKRDLREWYGTGR